MISTYSGGDSWLRKWSVIVSNTDGTNVLELSAGAQSQVTGGAAATGPQGQPLSEGLRGTFRTIAADLDTPNHAEIEIWNLSNKTAQRVQKEFSRVILQAGYSQGAFGTIFEGTLKQIKRGRLNATDTYLRLYAADADFLYNSHVIAPPGITVDRGSTQTDRIAALVDEARKNAGVQAGPIQLAGGTGGIAPEELGRGKTMWGLSNHNLDVTSGPYNQWSVQQGKLQVVDKKGYLPGEAVVLNAHSGLINVPEANQGGVFATCLLNPKIKVRGLVKINNAAINTSEPAVSSTQIVQQNYPGYTDINFFASTAADGTYVVLYIEHKGDTRGNDWYTNLMMLLTDPSAKAISPAQIAGLPASSNTDSSGRVEEHSF